MSEFYVNAITYGNKVLVRGYRDGAPFLEKVDFAPTLYVNSNKPTNLKTIYGQHVSEVKPGSISDANSFIEMYKNVDKFNVYGNTDYHRQFVSETYPGDIKYDFDLIKIYSIDIETTTENGFPDIQNPSEEITLISIKDRYTKHTTVFGVGKWGRSQDKVRYVECDNESNLMREFLLFWQQNYPDAITGWNINMFDIPYMVARITRVLGEKYANRLSPWGILYERNIIVNKRPEVTYRIRGIAILCYLELYKKFTYVTQESYKLDHIAFVELGENKKQNPGTSFKDFYTNYWDDFVEYNITDAHLVDMLDDKMRLLELVTVLSYFAKINYDDVFSPVGMWDSIIYNYLRDRGIVIPLRANKSGEEFEGAFVREPVAGYHKWIASFDLNSLYPHLIMQYNISPETITDVCMPSTVQLLLDQQVDTSYVIDNDLSMSGNGWCYRKDVRGFLPELMDKLYKDRSSHKKRMLNVEQEYEDTKNKELLKEISRLDNLQMALKIALNSLYGALGNAHFRYFDVRMAEGITQSGQLSSQWISNKLNSFMNKTMKTKNIPYVVYGDTDSVVGDSIIYVNGKRIKIEDYYNSISGDMILNDNYNQNYIKRVIGDNSLSFSNEKVIESKPIKYIMKHKVKKRMFKIKCDGKEVIVTEDHSVIVIRNDEICSVTPSNIKKTDSIITI
ncbi:PolB DNA polymerase elongation subunit (family B) [uncultured Caudovirales phage]|uniref:DNA-directed DNA polymerase n=1 Tax=uncultured Caudovirales phage TaxID=2100421 RepID=A0A6J5KXM8_9CAUD|nr:PolB DNA polymerase elongation subunit (family B) [uncultured Caudovirales phage]